MDSYYDLLRLPGWQRDTSESTVDGRPLAACARPRLLNPRTRRMPCAPRLCGSEPQSCPGVSGTDRDREGHLGVGERGIMALVDPMRPAAADPSKMLNENEFLRPYGLRSISNVHDRHPYVFHVHGQEYRVGYLPAESDTGMFGGNSNWRGPVWMPVNVLIIRALLNLYYYGNI